jgi:hypothetical protein
MISGKPYDHPAVRDTHVVSMTRASSDGRALSIATCRCGWCSAMPVSAQLDQDEAIERHWLEIISNDQHLMMDDSERFPIARPK